MGTSKFGIGMSVLRNAANLVRRFIADQRGNAMILTAAAIIPIMATIGGGFDISRAYLVKARLNEACDAAALAGRRAMTNEDINTATPEATKFFNFNFPQNFMGSASFTPAITHPDTGIVQVAASTSTPTTLMKIFGYRSIPVSVTCDATQNFDNLDIVLVLDTTGSMKCLPSDPASCSVTNEKSGSKMQGVRDAVMALYDQLSSAQTQLTSEGLRLRYGFVPYSSAVNVGKLIYAENSNYIVSGSSNYTKYWSRYPNWQKDSKGNYKLDSKGNKIFSSWSYGQVQYDMTNFVSGGTLTTPTGSNGSNETFHWGGCIEERNTTSSITGTSSTSSIPSGADDLNINEIPSSDATRWKAYLADAYLGPNNYNSPVYLTSGSQPQMACPVQASRLAVMTRDQVQSYVNTLYADGGTYHDNGMIWGTRFLSPNGIFGPENPTTYNDRPVHQFIIFMTDGFMDTGSTLYHSYGIEQLDKRVTGGYTTDSDSDARHQTRFLMACNAAKVQGVSIWTIDFGSSAGNDPVLKSCASSDDQYAVSASSNDLINKFAEIGKNIGALRLSQ